jgi:hypothetical protein
MLRKTDILCLASVHISLLLRQIRNRDLSNASGGRIRVGDHVQGGDKSQKWGDKSRQPKHMAAVFEPRVPDGVTALVEVVSVSDAILLRGIWECVG